MADKPLSKAGKKNAKRNAAKKRTGDGCSARNATHDGYAPEEMLTTLKQKLDEAKFAKEHELAGKLRDQIWVLTDLIKGVRTSIPDDELNPIIESMMSDIGPSEDSESKPSKAPATSNLTPEEKKVRSLKKKLDQIQVLKDKQKKGEKLEETQIHKIESEDSLKEEIEELEDLLEDALSLGH